VLIVTWPCATPLNQGDTAHLAIHGSSVLLLQLLLQQQQQQQQLQLLILLLLLPLFAACLCGGLAYVTASYDADLSSQQVLR